MPYYAPFYRPVYYNTAMPQDNPNIQIGQPYQQPFQQPFQQPTQPQQMPSQMPPQNSVPQQNNDIIWVQGEAGAKAYLVAPNNTVTLWDSENPVIYVKSSDANGVPSMRVLDFKERTTQPSQQTPEKHVCKCSDNFVKKEDFAVLSNRIDEIEKKFVEFENKQKEAE